MRGTLRLTRGNCNRLSGRDATLAGSAVAAKHQAHSRPTFMPEIGRTLPGMPAYVDTPTIQRSHGLSGHLIGDPIDDAHQVAERMGLSRSNFRGECITPHYTLPAGRRDAAIAAGAIPLDAEAWRRQLEHMSRTPSQRRNSARQQPEPQLQRRRATTTTTPTTGDLFGSDVSQVSR
jgi:hypothetical protein